MKLPDDIKQALTKELKQELHQGLTHHCLQCSSDISSSELFCSAVCLKEDIQKRKDMSKLASKNKAPKY